jgi:hypothetical protein
MGFESKFALNPHLKGCSIWYSVQTLLNRQFSVQNIHTLLVSEKLADWFNFVLLTALGFEKTTMGLKQTF